MPRRIIYILLSILVVSCSNEGDKEFKFREFNSSMSSAELKKIPGYRETKYNLSSPYESVLFFDKDTTDGYTVLIQKNNLDKSFAIKISLDIPKTTTANYAKKDAINAYRNMGKIVTFTNEHDNISYTKDFDLTFGCVDCKNTDNIDCDAWWDKLDHKMNMCINIHSIGYKSWMSIYWYNFKESENLNEFIRLKSESEREKK